MLHQTPLTRQSGQNGNIVQKRLRLKRTRGLTPPVSLKRKIEVLCYPAATATQLRKVAESIPGTNDLTLGQRRLFSIPTQQ